MSLGSSFSVERSNSVRAGPGSPPGGKSAPGPARSQPAVDSRRVSVGSDGAASPGNPALATGPSSPRKESSTEEAHIRVLTRVRPFNQREIELHQEAIKGKAEWDQVPLRSVVEFSGPLCIFLDNEKEWQEKERFQFDQCFWSISEDMQKSENGFADQEAIFSQYGEEILKQAWKGFNTCFFAYGQTGSGKTYSMMGDPLTNPGLIPRLCQRIFEQVEERRREAEQHKDTYVTTFRVEVRYIEIYNELVKDLLWTLSTLAPEIRSKVNHDNMKIRSSPATGVFVEHLTSVEVDGWERMIELIDLGNNSRHVAATKMNERSSRSHAIFKISLRQVTTTIPKNKFDKPTEHIRESQINLVDLAGSERNKKTGATGDRLKEAASINKSLSCLKGVIDALADNSTGKGPKKRIPYRDSHLTSLLMDSLGGNSKTYMLVCLSPHADNSDETFQTLRYGARARQIVNVVHVNENAASRAMMELEEELERMKENLDKTINSETVENLRAQIQEQEQQLARLEADREEQEKKLTDARKAREREMKSREAVAFANLHALATARVRKDEGATECVKLTRQLGSMVAERDAGEIHIEAAQAQIESKREATTQMKQRTGLLDHDIQQWERKQTRLAAFKKELVRTVEDQLMELRKIKDEKIRTIMRARLAHAKLSVALKRELRRLTKEKEDELKQAQLNAADAQKLVNIELVEKEKVLEDENKDLQKKVDAAEADFQKMETEKLGQIQKLEEELAGLKNHLKNLTEENAHRLRQTEADWEKKHAAMILDAEHHYESVQRHADSRHADMIQAKEKEYSELVARNQAKRANTIHYWEEKRKSIQAEWDGRLRDAEAKWRAKFDTKMAENTGMRAQLHRFEEEDKKYDDLCFRISSILDTLPNPRLKSAAYKKAHADILAFRAEYVANQPSKSRLEQLMRADFTLSRAVQAPVVGYDGEEHSEAVTPRRAASASHLKSNRIQPKNGQAA